MNLENKLKKKFLFSNKNVVKYLYLWFNKFFSSFKYRKSYSQGAMDLILKDIFRNKKKESILMLGVSIRFKIIILTNFIEKDGKGLT